MAEYVAQIKRVGKQPRPTWILSDATHCRHWTWRLGPGQEAGGRDAGSGLGDQAMASASPPAASTHFRSPRGIPVANFILSPCSRGLCAWSTESAPLLPTS
eukprot:767109-Hanusia_phi.AAC.8